MNTIRQFRSLGDVTRGLAQQQKLNVIPVAPKVIIDGAASVVALEDNPLHSIRIIKNVGVNPLKIMVNSVATAEMYCDIIAGGDVAGDGKGGSFDASAFQGVVYVFADDGDTTIATFLASEPTNTEL